MGGGAGGVRVGRARDMRHRDEPPAGVRSPGQAWDGSNGDMSRSTQGLYCPDNFLHERRRTMTFASVQELIEGTRQVIDFNGGVRVKDPAALRGGTIDRLVHTAVFGEGDVQGAAPWLIWEAGWAVGHQSASSDS